MAEVVPTDSFLAVFSELSPREQARIADVVDLLESFPEIYPVRQTGRFQGHRFFEAGNWLIYYKYRSGTVYLRSLWPARIPYSR